MIEDIGSFLGTIPCSVHSTVACPTPSHSACPALWQDLKRREQGLFEYPLSPPMGDFFLRSFFTLSAFNMLCRVANLNLTNQKGSNKGRKSVCSKALAGSFLVCLIDFANPKTTAYGKPDDFGEKRSYEKYSHPSEPSSRKAWISCEYTRKEVNVWFLTIH